MKIAKTFCEKNIKMKKIAKKRKMKYTYNYKSAASAALWENAMEHYLSLKDHVYRYISDCINTGSLNPGDKINEAQVSETLNISRTPIREALVQLASDGYLDSLPRKGFRVKALDTTKVQQFYEIIGALDGRAAALCVPYITKEDLNQMQFLAEAMDSAIHAGLGDKYYELQVEFHNVYLDRCPNTEMTDLFEAPEE